VRVGDPGKPGFELVYNKWTKGNHFIRSVRLEYMFDNEQVEEFDSFCACLSAFVLDGNGRGKSQRSFCSPTSRQILKVDGRDIVRFDSANAGNPHLTALGFTPNVSMIFKSQPPMS